MKVLWLCNIMLPAVAEHFHRESSNKEGWLSGLLTAVLSHGDSNGIELAVAFPVTERLPSSGDGHRGIRISRGENAQTSFTAYDFVEDTTRPDLYDPALEQELREICEDFAPGGALLRNGISTHLGYVQSISEKRPDTGRNTGTVRSVCEVLFRGSAGSGSEFRDLPGSGEKGYLEAPAGEIRPPR